MADLEINIKGIDATVKSLNRIASSDAMYSAMQASVIEMETWLKKYPPKPGAISGTSSSPVRFTTKGGKSADFMALSKGWKRNARGKATYVGYDRTGKLGQAWTTAVRQSVTETVGKVGNNIKYAKWVQAAATQAWMHVGRWRTDEQAIRQFEAKIVKRFRDAIERAAR